MYWLGKDMILAHGDTTERILLRVICRLIWFASFTYSLKQMKGSVLECFFSVVLGSSLIAAHMFPESWAFLCYKHLLPTGSCINVSQKALLLSIIFKGVLKAKYETRCCWNAKIEKKLSIGLWGKKRVCQTLRK